MLELFGWIFAQTDRPARADEPAKTLIRQIRLGETDVAVAITEKPGARFVYVNLHENESTSVEAVQDLLNSAGGRLFALRHGGRRNVSFTVAGREYRVDPNRIFTPAGVRATLTSQSQYSDEAARAAGRFAEELLALYHIEEADAVIALHNNSPGVYSAQSYASGGRFARDAEEVYVREGSNPDNFFFVTERVVFDALKRQGHDVVLQDNRRVTDDGSLSVYCGRANVRYVNVEAELGKRAEQARMLADLKGILEKLGPLKRR